MKTVVIAVTGNGRSFIFKNLKDTTIDISDYDGNSLESLEEEGLLVGKCYDPDIIISDIKVVIRNDEGEDIDITKKKGKYIISETYFKEMGLIVPHFAQVKNLNEYIICEYEIQLNDDEEFDPKKLQLVKSNYEYEFLPYGIMTEYIVYDGKKFGYDTVDSITDDRGDHEPCFYTGDYSDEWSEILMYL